jgi:hypothetical protein
VLQLGFGWASCVVVVSGDVSRQNRGSVDYNVKRLNSLSACQGQGQHFVIQTTGMSHRKRKHRERSDTYSNQYDLPPTPSSTRPDLTRFIVAHEADIIRGPQAARIADSLEVGINVDGQGGSRVGDSLIKWECKVGGDAEGGDMWVDRYVFMSRRACSICQSVRYRNLCYAFDGMVWYVE